MKPRCRKWLLRLALAVVPTLLLLGGTELVLRLAGYGFDPHFFVRAENGGLRANEKFAWRFMPRTLARAPSPERIAVPKPVGTSRVFLLGSSAAMGYPNPAFGVGRMLEVMLGATHPGQRFEVINTAMTAINSHVVAEIADECSGYEPDVFVVFTGNNEVVGPYGPGTVLSDVRSNRLVIRAGMALSASRLGQWLGSLAARNDSTRWGGMEMFASNAVPADDPRLKAVYANYRANLESICRSGTGARARVVLCTVPVNLRDCAPFNSEAAAARFARGRELWEAGRKAEAREHFVAARDSDAVRFRADSALVAAVRAVAKDVPKCVIADLEQGLERSSGGAPGDDFFLEHVHLNFDGNYQIALLMLDAIEPGSASRAPDAESCASALAYTPWDSSAEAKQVLELLARPPFGPQHENLRQHAREFLRDARARMTDAAVANARAVYERASRDRPDDFWIPVNFANFLAQVGDAEGEVAARRRIVALLPEAATAKVDLARALWKIGKSPEARNLCEQAAGQLPGNAAILKSIGDAFLENREFDAAAKQLSASLAIQPDQPAGLLNLAAIAQTKGDMPEAERLLGRSLKLQETAAAHSNLGNLLVRQHRATEALPHFEAAAKLEPTDVSSHQNLGSALLLVRKFPEAEAAFRALLNLDARNIRAEFGLGQASFGRGDWLEAELRWREVLARQPGFLPAARELAWLLATAPDDAVRRADEALSIATQLSKVAPEAPAVFDALAAAYANIGRFDEAESRAAHAAELAEKDNDPTAAEIRDRAALYRRKLPFRVKK